MVKIWVLFIFLNDINIDAVSMSFGFRFVCKKWKSMQIVVDLLFWFRLLQKYV